jgi:hypothetical protein
VEVKKQANALLVEWIMLLRQSIAKMGTAIDQSYLTPELTFPSCSLNPRVLPLAKTKSTVRSWIQEEIF